jgi:hypothetical protein
MAICFLSISDSKQEPSMKKRSALNGLGLLHAGFSCGENAPSETLPLTKRIHHSFI